ncbi:MAG TPA: anthranilate synthase component I [Candidatus Udaeobacter sp.]|nr:anthranilate synthase component I [Candidatus Udaeobacter sp.]
MYYPDFALFDRLAAGGAEAVPVMQELVLDTETPVSVFQKLRAAGPAFLLESVEGGETWGRYSLLAAGGRTRIRLTGSRLEVEVGGERRTVPAKDPLTGLRSLLIAERRADLPGIPRFAGCAVGYLGYDLVRELERLPATAEDDLGLPTAEFLVAETVVVFDHLSHTVKLIHAARIGADPRTAYARAIAALERTAAEIMAPTPPRSPAPAMVARAPFVSGMGAEAFKAGVEAIRELIRAGDAVQVVLSHRLSRPFAGDPFDTYRALRVINPSPYMFYLDFGDLQVAGASPEVLVRVEGRSVTVRPIAGTRPRGATPDEDRARAADLRADSKEQAEHLMLVDLGRNDLGRVCEFGSVEVEDFHTIERYSHVMHLVSGVRGRLRAECDCFDALRACFPAGTVTGAPKVRAMEIIEALEPTRRGIYAGAVGYVDFQGNLDTAIAIRTLVFHRGQAHVQAGAGIVADSTPEGELAETLAKAEALCRAVEMAEDGLALPSASLRREPAPAHLRRTAAIAPDPAPDPR